MKEYDYYHILPGRRGGFDVKGYDKYPRHSVLAGQTRIKWLANFATLEEAKAAYPQATKSHPMQEPINTFNHLPDGPDLDF